MIRILFALALLAPPALALDAFPSETHWGAREATFVVRASSPVVVRAPAGVNVTTLQTDWHGLPGASLMRATRQDGLAATLDVTDASGTGVTLEWPADAPPPEERHLPLPGWFAALALIGVAAASARRAR